MKILSAVIPTFFLFGCAVGPDFVSPRAPLTNSYTETELPEKTIETKKEGGETQFFNLGEDIPAKWWELFHSEPLNKLIILAINNNPTLQAAQAALKKAEEQLKISVANLFPFVDAQFTAERERFNPDIFNQKTPPATFNLFTFQLNISYTFDVFGGIRRRIESTAAQLENQKFEMEATFLNLTANVVTSAITEASLRAQIAATEELITAQANVLNITKKKFNLGGASQLEVLAQEAQLAQTQAALPLLELDLSRTRNALSVLIGELPSESKLPIFKLEDLQLPRELPVTIPSCLVRQRPDIRAAEALLHSASAEIGVATANLLPQFNINGTTIGWSATKFSKLFTEKELFWTLMGNIIQPIFHGGALIAQREATIDAFQEACAQYKATVLKGFQDVADTLRAIELHAYFFKIQSLAETAARQTLTITQSQYTIGAVDYVNLLVAQREFFNSRIAQIKAQASRYTDTAALFQALGGGWWNRKSLCIVPEYKN